MSLRQTTIALTKWAKAPDGFRQSPISCCIPFRKRSIAFQLPQRLLSEEGQESCQKIRFIKASPNKIQQKVLQTLPPKTTCQQLLSQAYRLFTKRTYSESREPEFPALLRCYSFAIIWRTSSRSIRLTLSSKVSLLVVLKYTRTM